MWQSMQFSSIVFPTFSAIPQRSELWHLSEVMRSPAERIEFCRMAFRTYRRAREWGLFDLDCLRV
jgi:hypothetical protein